LDHVGELAMLSAALNLGCPLVPNQKSGRYIIWEKSDRLVTLNQALPASGEMYSGGAAGNSAKVTVEEVLAVVLA
jgi:hypothetical protein